MAVMTAFQQHSDPFDSTAPNLVASPTELNSGRLGAHAPLLAGVIVALLALALYIRTLAPSVMPGDYAEFQFCAAILGVPHPTGYPLYILLGKLFTLLPFGDVAYRVNLSSAVYMAGATSILYACALRLLRLVGLGGTWVGATIGATFFTVAPTVWAMSLVARSYALNALLVAGVIFCLISWRSTGRTWWFFASCAMIGLSMAHHGTTYLLLPAYGLYLLLTEVERHRLHADARPWRRRILGVGSLLLGFSPMLFLVYRFLAGSPYYWGNPSNWQDFWGLVTGGPFHNQVLGYGSDLGSQVGRIGFGIGELSGQYTPIGIALGVVGLAVLVRLRRAEGGLLGLMMLGNFLFAMNYSLVGYLYFIPTYLIWGIFMAVGTGWLLHVLSTRLRTSHTSRASLSRIVQAVAAGIIAVVALSFVASRLPNIDLSGQTEVRDQALALLRDAPPNTSLYLDWEAQSVVRFYRFVYGMRPDIAIHVGDPADWPKGVYCDVMAGTPTYVGEFAGSTPPSVARDFQLEIAAPTLARRVTRILNPALYSVPPCGMCATCR